MENEVIQKAKDDAFNLISYRERSEAELHKRLSKKGYSKNVINKVISRLKELDYVNDRRFAEKWIRWRLNNKPRGRYLIEMELRKKGLEPDLIKRVLDNILSYELELKMGNTLAKKWLNSHPPCKKRDIKLKRYLKNKGFNHELIMEIVSGICS